MSTRRPTTCGVVGREQRCLADFPGDHEQFEVGTGLLSGASVCWRHAGSDTVVGVGVDSHVAPPDTGLDGCPARSCDVVMRGGLGQAERLSETKAQIVVVVTCQSSHGLTESIARQPFDHCFQKSLNKYQKVASL
jgi:hypothetical protein